MATPPTYGPDAMLSPDEPTTRGQWRTIAALALELLGVDLPESRLDGTVVAVRLRNALDDPGYAAPAVPDEAPF